MSHSMKCGVTFTVFDQLTRRPISRVTCDPEQISANVMPGQIAVRGRHEWSCVLAQDGSVELDAQRIADGEREQRRTARLVRIDELERKQLRPLRELQLDPANTEAAARLQAIESEIEQLRAGL